VPDGPLLAEPRAPVAAPAIDCPEALAIPRPASARAPLLLIPPNAEPIPETPDTPDADGENEARAPEPEIDAAELDACAEPVPWPAVWLGLFRAVPREPVAAWAIDCPDAPVMLRPASERAPLLATPEVEALDPETDGKNERLVPEPETDEAELEACAEPVLCPEAWLGLFRAVPREPVAAWANDCEEALAISQPDSARA